MAAAYRMDGWVKSVLGQAVAGALIYVCTQPANTASLPPSPLASIFSDPNGLVPIVQPIAADGFGHYDFYAAPGTYTVVVANFGVIQQVYPDQSIFGFASTSVLTAGANIAITGLTISVVGAIITNPVADQSIVAKSLLPATSNPSSQSLGNPGALWEGYFDDLTANTVTLAGPHGLTQLFQSQHAIGPGQLEVNTGLYLNSSLEVFNGVIQVLTNDAYISQFDGGFSISVQAGPRGKEGVITGINITSDVLTATYTGAGFSPGDVLYLTTLFDAPTNGKIVTVLTSSGTQFTATLVAANYNNPSVVSGEAVTEFLTASSTLNLPDITQGSGIAGGGFLTAVTAATNASAVGHLLFYSTGGVLIDSGIGGNTDIVFSNNTHGVAWVSGGDSILLSAQVPTGNFIISLPNVAGTVVTGGATTASATGGSSTLPANNQGFLEINLPNNTIVKIPYYNL